MRMLPVSVAIAAAKFESPGMIARIESRQQVRIGQFDQTPIQRRLIKSLRYQHLGDFGMAEGLVEIGQILQHRQPRSGTPQVRPAQQIARLLHRKSRRHFFTPWRLACLAA